MNAQTALLMVARTEFRPFTQGDWYAFSGCTSECPMIGENGNDIIIIDGDTINIYDEEGEYCYMFNLGDAIQIF
jgi:hypothetical protein